MIIVKEPSSATTVYVPCNTPKNCEVCSEILEISSPKKTYLFNVYDSMNLSDFYVFNIDLSEVEDGEYEYHLSCKSSGIIRIGNYVVPNKQYSSQREIVEYNAF